ncbi:T3SS effector HopA1 family protein [Pseudomonas aeruginosa]|uniref:lanthionine synthetase LanC family protein n=16 Tax=Pseudomonas aeruginosa TaxID=287 RepID=UPI0018DFAF53|nr:lanthionine synthetase LanC family protein [Pseudomonas aeruginosa]MBI7024819.1 hypothetical protein [Pseudomonas aeruginosa]MBI9165853.1 hypothetical protein [Pseudomonas aeruginosa]MCO4017612.1 hypothetical protein [Pseudomonas aeruginosa]MCY0312462.1 T3SS effector HopA1 family protein [Pseudomonas aeruginosa]MCY0514844.1 T3SS effector HopA1 family protein [Pseudomonas aeruginosa]
MNARTAPEHPWWERLAPLLNDLRCDAHGHLHVDGRIFAPHLRAQAADSPATHDDPRVAQLQQHLYQRYYAGLEETPDASPPLWRPAPGTPLVSGPWQVLEQLADGALVATRGPLTRRLEPGEYLFEGAPARARRHDLVSRQRSRWSERLDPAFLYLFGAAESDACSDDAMLRYYFAVRPERLGDLVVLIRQALDRAQLPFSLKYPLQPAALLRLDAVVLYGCARHARQLHATLASLRSRLAELLRPVQALWTQALMPGLGFAQDPDDGLSFGESRCRALARGMLDAALAASGTPLTAIRERFVAAGIDWHAPHLEEDEDDRFGLRQLRFAPPQQRVAAITPALADTRLWRETLAIGNQLCAEALWYGPACTWIGDDADDENGRLDAFTRSMNGNLYDGTLGVAAYLARLAGCSGDHLHRETAVGALWHALRQPAAVSLGFYEGRLGIVAQGLGIARELDEAPLLAACLDAAGQLLERLPEDTADSDLMHGLAGAVLGLLELARQAPALAEHARQRACRYGRRLIALASKTPHGWHWPADNQPLGLCGLSHGNSGIALAFAALQREAPTPDWREALRGALDYEGFWYLPRQRNWPYLFAEDASSFDDRPQNCGMAWCHGAPGIALARLALWRLGGDRAMREQALATFATVAEDLQAGHGRSGDSYNLCHGPAGNADMLLDAAHYLAQPHWERLARDVARRGVAQQAERWRSGLGVADGHAQGLMLGLAGTGYFLLRCALGEPSPSLLLPPGLLS